ncbi:hypothetical protein G3A43_07765 [Paraburkholderia aspalathi]|nr:hypothetical protein [Paraburkholderia aspalathi]MBK3780152.1 hypothetical protein [Paraburkholderia aspalathi]
MPKSRLNWTDEDDIAACRQGWWLAANRYRTLIRHEGGLPTFRTDEEAVEFVRKQAQKGDPLAIKAMKLHEEGLRKPAVDHGPQPEVTQVVVLDI